MVYIVDNLLYYIFERSFLKVVVLLLEKTICELFAGVGGFRLGLEKASSDWETVWANQWEPGRKSQHAFDCYCSHFGNSESHVNANISTIEKKLIADHNLLVGGFPCQDYSVARTGAKGIHGKKGVLWWDIRDTIEAKKPKFILLENVDRLLKSPASQRGRDMGVMLGCLNDLGYNVEWRVINAAEYGFAQRRRRVFIFGYHRSTSYAKRFEDSSLLNLLQSDGFFANGFPIEPSNGGHTLELKYEDIYELSDNFKFDFHNAGIMANGSIFTSQIVPIYENPITLREILQSDVPEEYYINGSLEKWENLKGAKKIPRTSKSGHSYVFSEGPIAFPDPIDKPARTMLTSESSLNRSTHVIKDPETKRLRLITPLEAERIQGFDDNWTNTGMPHKFRYFCMGNALVVGLVTRMGKYISEIFDEE